MTVRGPRGRKGRSAKQVYVAAVQLGGTRLTAAEDSIEQHRQAIAQIFDAMAELRKQFKALEAAPRILDASKITITNADGGTINVGDA